MKIKSWEGHGKKRIYINHSILEFGDKFYLQADSKGKVEPVLQKQCPTSYYSIFNSQGYQLCIDLMIYFEEEFDTKFSDDFEKEFKKFN